MEFSSLPAHLESIVLGAVERFHGVQWQQPYPGSSSWIRAELLGHLIDSAINNLQRFVRATIEGALEFPSYPQIEMVAVQQYAQAPVQLLIDLWRALNLQIARVLSLTPAEVRQAVCIIGTNAPMTFETMALDYIAHLEHHLRQLLGDDALRYSELRWPPPERWTREIRGLDR